MKKEIWKHLPDLDGIIQISNLGRVKKYVVAINSEGKKFILYDEILKIYPRNYYPINAKQRSLLRDIGELFFKNYNNEEHILTHKDKDTTNNIKTNLKIIKRHSNRVQNPIFGEKNHKSNMSDEERLVIIDKIKRGVKAKLIYTEHQIHPANITRVRKKLIWKHLQ